MPKKSLTIDGKEFDSQTAAIEHFRSMLNRHTAGEILVEEDAAELASLLLRHPEAADKIGVGIDHFEVRPPPEFGGLCFWIIRTDQSATDFSFMTCIRGKGMTVSQEFREACRMAVQNDIAKAKQVFFKVKQDASGRVACEVTGRPLTLEDAHADHREPMRFEVIVAVFLASKQLDEPDPTWLTKSKDAQSVTTFVGLALREEFRGVSQALGAYSLDREARESISRRSRSTTTRKGIHQALSRPSASMTSFKAPSYSWR